MTHEQILALLNQAKWAARGLSLMATIAIVFSMGEHQVSLTGLIGVVLVALWCAESLACKAIGYYRSNEL